VQRRKRINQNGRVTAGQPSITNLPLNTRFAAPQMCRQCAPLLKLRRNLYDSHSSQKPVSGPRQVPYAEPLSLGSLWSDVLGLPGGLSCPQVGGLSDLICGGVSPISDAEATITPLKGQRYLDALNAYCSARGRAKFVADWVPGGGTIARDIWNSPIGAALGAYQLPTADIDRITEETHGAQTVALHGASEGLKAAAGTTAILYAIRSQTSVPMSVSSKLLSGAATVVLVGDAVFGFAKEAQEILNCQAGH
jgi:hypothetical protein